MPNGLIDVIMIAAIVLTLNAIILYVVIRLAVKHALGVYFTPDAYYIPKMEKSD